MIGDGPDFAKIKARAGSNVQLLGQQPFSVLCDHMQRARAFVFAAEEDFGIAPVEAQSCGTPVIAYGKGGALETIRGLDTNLPTGVFFNEQSTASLIEAVSVFESERERIFPTACRDNAQRFSVAAFRQQFQAFVQQALGKAGRR